MTPPCVSVGILHADKITIELNTPYVLPDGSTADGCQMFTLAPSKKIEWHGQLYDYVELTTPGFDGTFAVDDVVIGIGFHWERAERQSFKGNLRLIIDEGTMCLVNILPVEDYLLSVISSEMSATAGEEFLKAHAVISRSWLLAQINKSKQPHLPMPEDTETEIVRWYDRDDHHNFDVCADDHCQRYQGITRQTTEAVARAVKATKGQVLMDDEGQLCDTRFSKCCGGVFEEFENCWEPRHYHYLVGERDAADSPSVPDLSSEEGARNWIMARPEAFCNTADKEILGQVLNGYDQETTDFYRWTVTYSQQELAELIRERSGIDFGGIKALEPLARGTSGRIYRLRIVGEKRTLVIGKELIIRRWLSSSHLYSSAFVVENGQDNAQGLPSSFTLRGAGWGHGVGLCQIGAAVMGAKGYDYRHILLHYFRGAALTTLY